MHDWKQDINPVLLNRARPDRRHRRRRVVVVVVVVVGQRSPRR